MLFCFISFFFFFNDTATTEIYTLSLHDALPISSFRRNIESQDSTMKSPVVAVWTKNSSYYSRRPEPERIALLVSMINRSEEHTSELQSQSNLVCRLLLEKKKKQP